MPILTQNHLIYLTATFFHLQPSNMQQCCFRKFFGKHFLVTNHITFFSTTVWATQISCSGKKYQFLFSLRQNIRPLGKFVNFQKLVQKNRYLPEIKYLKLLLLRKNWFQFRSPPKRFVNIHVLKVSHTASFLSTYAIFPICCIFSLVRAYRHVEKKVLTT